MEKVTVGKELNLSRLVHGMWRLTEWDLKEKQLLGLIVEIMDQGITSFDHADIYGDYECEALFGKALRLNPGIREKMELVTKCGIKLLSSKFPGRRIKHYDYSHEHIIASAERSLQNLNTDRIDLLLLHRPSPFFDPEEAAKAFSQLRKEGKVLNFGVSNFNPMQFEMLEKYCDLPLLTNQVEISPYCLEQFGNGNMDFFMKEKIRPMAWSPLGGGTLLNPGDEKGRRLLAALEQVSGELGADSTDMTIYAWLLKHPSGIIPVLGTSRIERVKKAVAAIRLKMDLEQWFRIFTASTGNEMP